MKKIKILLLLSLISSTSWMLEAGNSNSSNYDFLKSMCKKYGFNTIGNMLGEVLNRQVSNEANESKLPKVQDLTRKIRGLTKKIDTKYLQISDQSKNATDREEHFRAMTELVAQRKRLHAEQKTILEAHFEQKMQKATDDFANKRELKLNLVRIGAGLAILTVTAIGIKIIYSHLTQKHSKQTRLEKNRSAR